MRTALPICALLVLLAIVGSAGLHAAVPEIGIDEHLGDTISLENLSLFGEDGQPVDVQALFDRPVILTLVYFRCPGICTPLLQELAANVDLSKLQPGEDYRIVTVSFDPADTADMAKNKRDNLLATLERKEVPPEGWRFLTGTEETIRELTDAVGFRYTKNENGIDFVHAATVIFLSKEGKIVRYLNGTRFNPADLEMAVVDASEGRARSFMQRMQRLCYSYDPAGRAYVLKLNRIILGVTLLFAGAFAVFLFSKNVTRKNPKSHATGSA
jgi:protein SCO1/2